VSAEIIRFADFCAAPSESAECDLVTAVDVAIRDLREILQHWGTDGARERAQECESMLSRVFRNSVTSPSAS